jgi:hypothetical protein
MSVLFPYYHFLPLHGSFTSILVIVSPSQTGAENREKGGSVTLLLYYRHGGWRVKVQIDLLALPEKYIMYLSPITDGHITLVLHRIVLEYQGTMKFL